MCRSGFFCFKQKTAYEMRISDWSSDVCSSDLSAKCAYDLPTIRHWLENFLHRFFAISQFKRSALPNGPKVSSGGALSPRGDWRAPSDGTDRKSTRLHSSH